MSTHVHNPPPTSSPQRLDAIARARQVVLQERSPNAGNGLIDAWIERSWQRCLTIGLDPLQPVTFDALSTAAMRQAGEANRMLTEAARLVLQELGRALADTRYFVILTNAQGVVVDVNGPIDRRDRRTDLITRIGADLSEQCVGTTAIGAALAELQPVWLHRGEHFFNDTSSYSCAGAPLFGPRGECVGMLDLTGVDTPERPELKHLVVQSARSIENILTLRQKHTLRLRLNWPGHRLGTDTDGLLGLDADGHVVASNGAARQMLPLLPNAANPLATNAHGSELFAVPLSMLFDAARHPDRAVDVPLWSGLHLQVLAASTRSPLSNRGTSDPPPVQLPPAQDPRRLKDIETALIRKAVDDARGNVSQAAARLGVSRATVYRKLGLKRV